MTRGPRDLIVLSDGTGNSASKPFKTNVWRLYQALNLRDGKQVAVFGDGVGTSDIKILRVIGLALGFGVKRNVLNLYKFLCRNYWQDKADPNQHDRIWMFGFSRGAFTIRVLAGLFHSQGLITFESESELEQNAADAYRAYRKDQFHTFIPWVWVGRRVRDVVVSLLRKATGRITYTAVQAQTKALRRDKVHIHFVGVWDTVVAYGLPIDELTIAVDKWVWPMKFRDTSLLERVDHARHALALDDERRTFHPVPWDEKAERNLQAKNKVVRGRLLQVWFPGMHADVGGGYPDDGLSFVPLCWMIDEAKAIGLRFEGEIVDTYRALASPTGRLYDSRAGSGFLWRYQPRNVQFLMDNNKDDVDDAEKIRPLVHHSMVTRMSYGNDGYAPISLPIDVDILTPDGKRVAFGDVSPEKKAAFGTMSLGDAIRDTQEKKLKAKEEDRPVFEHTEIILDDFGRLVDAASQIQREPHHALVLDTVWLRRLVYFITLGLALTALAYPVVYELLDWGDKIEKVNGLLGLKSEGKADVGLLETITNGLFVWIAGMVRAFLPSFATPWLDAITRNGLSATLIALAFLLSLAVSTFLQRRIYDRSRAAWNIRPRDGLELKRLELTGQRHALLTFAVVFSTLAVLTYPVYAAHPEAGYLKVALYIFLALGFLSAAAWIFRLIKPAKAIDPEHPRFPLGLARYLRTSRPWLKSYRCLAQTILPILFILAAGYLALSVLNIATFNVQSTVGSFCKVPAGETKPQDASQKLQAAREQYSKREITAQKEIKKAIVDATHDEQLEGEQIVDIASLCHHTNFRLVAGRQYRIRLEMDQAWFDKSIPADVAGFTTDGIRHALASPLKRWWLEKWFQPVARVGRFGNYEYPLKPAAPLAEANFSPCELPNDAEQPNIFQQVGNALMGLVNAALHPGKTMDAIGEPAPQAVREEKLACEQKEEIARAKVLISDITPATTGELYIYVNDAVLALPGRQDTFYRNNIGTAKVTVTRTRAPATIDKD